MNRARDEAYTDPRFKPVFDEYHKKLRKAVLNVKHLKNALFIDIHGQMQNNLIQIGYDVLLADLGLYLLSARCKTYVPDRDNMTA